MKTYYLWKLINGKKIDVAKLTTSMTREEVKQKFCNFDYDGIDVVRSVNLC